MATHHKAVIVRGTRNPANGKKDDAQSAAKVGVPASIMPSDDAESAMDIENIDRSSPEWTTRYDTLKVRDMCGEEMWDAPLDFYTQMPSNAPALFSTAGGKWAKRSLMYPLPRRNLLHWGGLKIEEKVYTIRKKIPLLAKRAVEPPKAWADLYIFWDAVDLYCFGAYNLWNVLSLMASQNGPIRAAVEVEQTSIVEMWIDQWLSAKENVDKLSNWNGRSDVFSLLHHGDIWGNGGVGQLEQYGMNLLRMGLYRRHHRMMQGRLGASKPEGGVSVENWLDTTASALRHTSRESLPPLDPILEDLQAESKPQLQVPSDKRRVASAPQLGIDAKTLHRGPSGMTPLPANHACMAEKSVALYEPAAQTEARPNRIVAIVNRSSPSSDGSDPFARTKDFFPNYAGNNMANTYPQFPSSSSQVLPKTRAGIPLPAGGPQPAIVRYPAAMEAISGNLAPSHLAPAHPMPHFPEAGQYYHPLQPGFPQHMHPIAAAQHFQAGMLVQHPPVGQQPGPHVAHSAPRPGTYHALMRQPLTATGSFGPPHPQPIHVNNNISKLHHGSNGSNSRNFSGGLGKASPSRDGWKSKGVESVHGPVYTRPGRKDGNPSAGRVPSATSTPHRGPSQYFPRDSPPECLNPNKGSPEDTYLACYCRRCGPRNRTIHVAGFNDNLELGDDLAAKIAAHCGRWGKVEGVFFARGGKHYGFVLFRDEDVAVNMVQRQNGKAAQEISGSLRISYPTYSRYYQPRSAYRRTSQPTPPAAKVTPPARDQLMPAHVANHPPYRSPALGQTNMGNPYNPFHEPEKYKQARAVSHPVSSSAAPPHRDRHLPAPHSCPAGHAVPQILSRQVPQSGTLGLRPSGDVMLAQSSLAANNQQTPSCQAKLAEENPAEVTLVDADQARLGPTKYAKVIRACLPEDTRDTKDDGENGDVREAGCKPDSVVAPIVEAGGEGKESPVSLENSTGKTMSPRASEEVDSTRSSAVSPADEEQAGTVIHRRPKETQRLPSAWTRSKTPPLPPTATKDAIANKKTPNQSVSTTKTSRGNPQEASSAESSPPSGTSSQNTCAHSDASSPASCNRPKPQKSKKWKRKKASSGRLSVDGKGDPPDDKSGTAREAAPKV